MTFSYQDCLTIEEILADVLVQVDDEELKQFTRGWYKRQIRTGLEKLNYTAPFLPLFKDIDITSNLVIPVPSGVWDIADMFIWNKDSECDCKMKDTVRLFHKRNYMSKGYDMGYTSRHMSGSTDYLMGMPYRYDYTVFFYNVVMGNFILSDACNGYEKLRIHYNGVPSDIDTVKFIPPFLRDALITWGVLQTFGALKARDANKYRALWGDAKTDLYQRNGLDPSKWDEAKSLLKKVDRKAINDLAEYLGKINA